MLNKDEKSSNEMPVLARVPIFGAFFRSQEVKKEESQLLIFITPTIV
jgi:type II secretory pathway component HofQ